MIKARRATESAMGTQIFSVGNLKSIVVIDNESLSEGQSSVVENIMNLDGYQKSTDVDDMSAEEQLTSEVVRVSKLLSERRLSESASDSEKVADKQRHFTMAQNMLHEGLPSSDKDKELFSEDQQKSERDITIVIGEHPKSELDNELRRECQQQSGPGNKSFSVGQGTKDNIISNEEMDNKKMSMETPNSIMENKMASDGNQKIEVDNTAIVGEEANSVEDTKTSPDGHQKPTRDMQAPTTYVTNTMNPETQPLPLMQTHSRHTQVVNVSGTRFEMSETTWAAIRKDMAAGDRCALRQTGSEVFLERHAGVFQSILYYHQGGELHLPENVCPSSFRRELQFYGVEEATMAKCCFTKYVNYFDDQEVLKILENDETHRRTERATLIQMKSRGGWKGIQALVWLVLNEPFYSRAAKVYFAASAVLVMVSLFALVAGTHPSFQRNLKIHEWQEYFGEDWVKYKKYFLPQSGSEPETSPLSKSKQETKAEPEATSEPETKTHPDITSVPKNEPESDPEMKSEPESEVEPEAGTKSESETEPNVEPESESEPETRQEPEDISDSKTEPESNPEFGTTAEPESSPEPVLASEPETTVKSLPETISKQENKSEPETTPKSKSETDTNHGLDSASESEPSKQPGSTSEANSEPETIQGSESEPKSTSEPETMQEKDSMPEQKSEKTTGPGSESEPVTNRDSEPEPETKPDSESEPETKPDSESAESETETKPDAESETETKPDAESETETKPDAQSEPEAKPDAESEPETRKDTESEPETKPDTESEPETKPDAESETETKPDAESETETKPDAESEPETKPDAESEPEIKPDSESEPETKLDAESEPETKPDSESEPETKPDAESEPETKPDSEFEPETKPDAESEPETKPDSESEPETKPDSESAESEPETKPDAESEPETKPDAESEPETKPDSESEPETKPDSESEPETKPKSEAKSEAESESEEEPFPMPENAHKRYLYLEYIEYTSLAAFSVDLIIRIIFCPFKLNLLFSFLNWVDVFALSVMYARYIVEELDPKEQYEASPVDILHCLQIVRVFRLFRLVKNFVGFRVLMYAFKASVKEMMLMSMFLFIAMLIFSTFAFFSGDDTFTSIPDAFWWAIVTMTTVGYGDVVPKQDLSRFIGVVCAISGVCLIAVIIPIFVNNFMLFYSYSKVWGKKCKSGHQDGGTTVEVVTVVGSTGQERKC